MSEIKESSGPHPRDLGLTTPYDSETGIDGEKKDPYDRFPSYRKTLMLVVQSWCGFMSPISSTAILPALPNVATTFNTNGTVVSLSNALYIVFMAISPCLWGPVCQFYGRKRSCIATSILLLLASIATALAPDIASFMVFRMLTALFATAFLVIGPAIMGDLFRPTERATALGWFYSGTLIGPCIGPLLGGIIVTYTSWRVIFWLQAGLTVVCLVGLVAFMSETLVETENCKKAIFKRIPSKSARFSFLATEINPLRPLRLLVKWPNLALVAFGSGSIIWNVYGLLTPITYILNPRFKLETPTQSGLFYLAPGLGAFFGTFIGGRWADHTVKRWIQKRDGHRMPEDRLRSCAFVLVGIMPASMLVYGWTVDQAVGGIAVPVISMFVQGLGQGLCMPCLNSYIIDVMQSRSAESVAGNFLVRYICGAISTAVVLPVIEAIGVGWFGTISALSMVFGGSCVCVTLKWGAGWREKIGVRSKMVAEGG